VRKFCRKVAARSQRGISYEVADKSRSELYLDLLPLINSRAVSLLDHDKLFRQLITLERRTARSGKDSIDHTPGSHDDVGTRLLVRLFGLGQCQATRPKGTSSARGQKLYWAIPDSDAEVMRRLTRNKTTTTESRLGGRPRTPPHIRFFGRYWWQSGHGLVQC
jgi:hypothetical protein